MAFSSDPLPDLIVSGVVIIINGQALVASAPVSPPSPPENGGTSLDFSDPANSGLIAPVL